MENKENYLADKPIGEEVQDRFQRYSFSRRIADTIIRRATPDSIVIGIYGEWGEGKTSVLNFIEKCLIQEESIVICKFNPWRYKDETQLLLGFFNTLAIQLKKSIKTKSEKISETISEYADIVIPSLSFLESLIGVNPTETIKKISDKISTVDVEEQKKRLEKILADEKKRVVIFIDDIDRLDKKEIQSVFKLVKLTGDFAYTSYILAFDEKMVSKAIGEIYEDGGEQAGRNFLEKIIQVPLRLPLAQKEALRDFCFELVNNALSSNNIDLSENQAGEFVNKFTSCVLNRLSTPRLAVRYGNALSFSLPLLYGEVNSVDLMLIESIKIFYPDFYNFIRQNPDYFIRVYSTIHSYSYDNKANEARKQECKQVISKLLNIYSEKEQKAILELLTYLFPILKEVYNNYSHHEGSYKKWYESKRIGSPQYFQRYFTYTVIKGQISDVQFDILIENLRTRSEPEAIKLVQEFVSLTEAGDFIWKLRWHEDTFDEEISKKIILILSKLGPLFPHSENSLFGFDTPLGQAASIIYKLLSHVTNEEKFRCALSAIQESKPFSLTYEIMRSIERDNTENKQERVFSTEETRKLEEALLAKAINEADPQPLFEKFIDYANYLLSRIWLPINGKDSLMKYIKRFLDDNPAGIINLLRAYSPKTHSTAAPEPYYGDLSEEVYGWIETSFDTTYLFNCIVLYLNIDPQMIEYQALGHKQTEENRLKQFVYLYRNKESKQSFDE